MLERPLRDITHAKGLASSHHITWTPEAEESFLSLKKALQSPPVLGVPDPDKPFVQCVDEKSGCMTSVLLQKHGTDLRPVAYFSCSLDPVARALPHCLRAVAAAEKAVLASRDFVGFSDLTLLVPHAVSNLLAEQKTSHLSAARWLRYHTTLLDLPHVKVKRCTTLNPATLLPLPTDGTPHCCETEVSLSCSPRPDLRDTPLENPDLIFYVDGSASRDPETGSCHAGFAVVDDHTVIHSSSLPSHFSAQAAELVALTEACKLAGGQSVTIYTDSRYAFGVVHDFGALWRHRRFLKSDGKPILHHDKVSALLEAILLPKQIAVCKCAAHTSSSDPVSAGNARADAAAKSASLRPVPHTSHHMLSQPVASLSDLCSLSSPEERKLWAQHGCVVRDGVWYGPDGKPCLPKKLFPCFAKLTHGLDHVSRGGMCTAVQSHWFTKGFSTVAADYCNRCMVCAKNNSGRAVSLTQPAAHPVTTRPFQHLMLDFIELHPSEGKKYCLTMVDMFSKWVEVFPAKHATAAVVAKALISEIIPRWGIPEKISSDNGSHFVNDAIKQVSEYLGFDTLRILSAGRWLY